MSTNILPPSAPGYDELLGEDLASLACNAAIELDNLILGRSPALDAVRKLSYRLTEELPNATDLASPKYLVDPSTVVVLSRVIRESSWAAQPSEVQELTRTAGEIAQRLLAVSDDPATESGDATGLQRLRSFCLVLSKRVASARGPAVETRPPHPYRKQG